MMSQQGKLKENSQGHLACFQDCWGEAYTHFHLFTNFSKCFPILTSLYWKCCELSIVVACATKPLQHVMITLNKFRRKPGWRLDLLVTQCPLVKRGHWPMCLFYDRLPEKVRLETYVSSRLVFLHGWRIQSPIKNLSAMQIGVIALARFNLGNNAKRYSNFSQTAKFWMKILSMVAALLCIYDCFLCI